MEKAIKCFVCHVKTDDWRNELHGLKSQHSCTFVTDFIKSILGDFNLMQNIDDESNCICADCLNRFEEYDWTCTLAKQYEKELYDLLVKTESLRRSELKGEVTDVDPPVNRPFEDPLIEFPEQPFRSDDLNDDDEELLKVMVEPIDVLPPKDDELQDFAMDSGAIDSTNDDPDFNYKVEYDSNYEDIEDDDYVPRKSATKPRKTKSSIGKIEDSTDQHQPKKRGRKPKNKDEQGEQKKPRKKREKKTYVCTDQSCEKTFEKLIDYVVSKYGVYFFNEAYFHWQYNFIHRPTENGIESSLSQNFDVANAFTSQKIKKLSMRTQNFMKTCPYYSVFSVI